MSPVVRCRLVKWSRAMIFACCTTIPDQIKPFYGQIIQAQNHAAPLVLFWRQQHPLLCCSLACLINKESWLGMSMQGSTFEFRGSFHFLNMDRYVIWVGAFRKSVIKCEWSVIWAGSKYIDLNNNLSRKKAIYINFQLHKNLLLLSGKYPQMDH